VPIVSTGAGGRVDGASRPRTSAAIRSVARMSNKLALKRTGKRSSDARSGWAVLRRATRSCTSGTGTTTPGTCREPRSADQSPGPRIWDTASASYSLVGQASLGNRGRRFRGVGSVAIKTAEVCMPMVRWSEVLVPRMAARATKGLWACPTAKEGGGRRTCQRRGVSCARALVCAQTCWHLPQR
jgi:hypothetical protein